MFEPTFGVKSTTLISELPSAEHTGSGEVYIVEVPSPHFIFTEYVAAEDEDEDPSQGLSVISGIIRSEHGEKLGMDYSILKNYLTAKYGAPHNEHSNDNVSQIGWVFGDDCDHLNGFSVITLAMIRPLKCVQYWVGDHIA